MALLVSVALVLSGCSLSTQSARHGETNDAGSDEPLKALTVKQRDLTPVVSLTGTVSPSPSFTVNASAAGIYQPAKGVGAGTAVLVGSLLGTVGDVTIVSPVDGVVEQLLVAPGQTVPVQLPLNVIRFSGFGIEGALDPSVAWMTLIGIVAGKAQITNGAGPFDCVAMVNAVTVASGGAKDTTAAESSTSVGAGGSRICLVPKDTPTIAGAEALVVMTSVLRKNILAVPLTSVAGRRDVGQVTLIRNGKKIPTNVSLGASDGQYIEITKGLTSGDMIASSAPTLAAKYIAK